MEQQAERAALENAARSACYFNSCATFCVPRLPTRYNLAEHSRQSGITDGAGEAGAVAGEERARGEAGPVFLPGPDRRS